MKNYFTLLMCGLMLSIAGKVSGQDLDSTQVSMMLDNRNYVFEAKQAYPQNGLTRILTPGYELVVRGDTVSSFLPYFGRAYSAPVNLSEGGIKFTSTLHTYEVKKRKSKWEIKIKPQDVADVQEIDIDIFDNGVARVQFINTNRQPISFDGNVVKGKALEKRAF